MQNGYAARRSMPMLMVLVLALAACAREARETGATDGAAGSDRIAIVVHKDPG